MMENLPSRWMEGMGTEAAGVEIEKGSDLWEKYILCGIGAFFVVESAGDGFSELSGWPMLCGRYGHRCSALPHL